MSYGVVIPVKIAAKNIDAWNRTAVSAAAQENGNIMELVAKSATAGESEVWTAVQPATSHLSNLWMVLEPEVVLTVSGSSYYKGLDPDVRNFIVKIGDMMSVYKPAIGDLILVSADAVGGSLDANTYAVATNVQWQLQWAAAAVSGLSYHLVETTYISIGTGTIGTQRVTAYLLECVAVA